MKTCIRCNTYKPLSEFRSVPKGISKNCNKCLDEKIAPYRIKYRKNNVDKIKEYEKRRTDRRRNSLKDRWQQLKTRGHRDGIDITLTRKQFDYILRKNQCYYCGEKLSDFGSALDRLDSRQGYLKGNCVACCKYCNAMKSTQSYKDFIKKIKTILKRVENHEGKNSQTIWPSVRLGKVSRL
jgi:hypothetical protein